MPASPASSRPPVRKAVIPAAGRGTRFLPFSKSVPKVLAPIVTTPALDFVVSEAAAHGMSEVLLVLSEGQDAIVDYFLGVDDELEAALAAKGDHARLASVRRPRELATVCQTIQHSPRGLGDAVAHGRDFAAGEPVVVLLADDFIDDRDELLAPMLDVYAEHGGAVIGLLDVGPANIGKYGCVAPAPGSDPTADVVAVADLVEKPPRGEEPSTLAIIGRYVLPPEVFDALAATQPGSGGEIQLTDAIRALAADGIPVHGVVFRGRRYDTGNPLDYMRSVVQLATRHPDIGDEFSAWLREYVTGLG